jgi:hypothetical protein
MVGCVMTDVKQPRSPESRVICLILAGEQHETRVNRIGSLVSLAVPSL